MDDEWSEGVLNMAARTRLLPVMDMRISGVLRTQFIITTVSGIELLTVLFKYSDPDSLAILETHLCAQFWFNFAIMSTISASVYSYSLHLKINIYTKKQKYVRKSFKAPHQLEISLSITDRRYIAVDFGHKKDIRLAYASTKRDFLSSANSKDLFLRRI